MKNSLVLVSVLSFVLLFGLLLFGCSQQATPTVAPTIAPTFAPTNAPTTGVTQTPTQTPSQTIAPSVAGGEASVSISGFAFNPAELRVAVGTRVTWTNADAAPHSIVSDSGSELASPTFGSGESFSHVFASAGTFAYHCSIHPSMTGTVIVS